jgi:hypothetical protein
VTGVRVLVASFAAARPIGERWLGGGCERRNAARTGAAKGAFWEVFISSHLPRFQPMMAEFIMS